MSTLGQLPIESDPPRDALHIAVVKLTALRVLKPGVRVLYNKDEEGVYATSSGKYLGVVDPFLARPVQPGEKVYILMAPGSTANLRHEWSHPDLPEPGYEEIRAGLALVSDGLPEPEEEDDECKGCN